MAPIAITAYTSTTALGQGLAAQAKALHAGRSGLRHNDFGAQPLPCWVGRVEGVEDVRLPAELAEWDCRNNRLAWLALQQDGLPDAVAALSRRHGTARIAIVLGTSTSSIEATEQAYRHLQQGQDGRRHFPVELARPMLHTPHSLSAFVQAATGLNGPCLTVATACSSSAKVFAQASRLIHSGLADAALVGGVDSLCDSVLFGFNSLQLVDVNPCRPFDARRAGLSLGEAGGFAILERADQATDPLFWLCGYGESSDAHHMSHPHPEGLGARIAMSHALARGGISVNEVGYMNLHGTATPANDRIEATAIAALFPETLHASSTKAWTGHTLGAAGIVESVIALLALRDGRLPETLNSTEPDPDCGPQIRFHAAARQVDYAMSNSFGFGGNNCTLLFGRA